MSARAPTACIGMASRILTPPATTGVIFAFRGSIPDEPTHTFPLPGLGSKCLYRIHFQDASSPDFALTGAAFMQSSLSVHLHEPHSSDIVFIDSTAPRSPAHK